ncbi:hypothetical protein POM88_004641 [Heracleum sosnowskyi]|uniref:Replication factor A C-terminal domain-containing protein n=1 Tax=Heracleum sosnowskyi TaxID=360622 RepID=A0AAD8JJX7_9APIA|nr:hypothetical protein POM88_004641 [Heracleum sosnowskyi]
MQNLILRSSINVTFWDSFAEQFDKEMNQVLEKLTIIILSGCRVGLWNDEVDLSRVGGTQWYLNYNHYNVVILRKKLAQPDFSQQMYALDKHKRVELLNVATIKSLGKDYIMREVCAHLNIQSVEENEKWYCTVCTDCEQEVVLDEENWFTISAVATDDSGSIELMLDDQQIRPIIGKRAVQVFKQKKDEASSSMQQDTTQASNATYHLDGLSQLNFQSPTRSKTTTK